MVYDFIVIGSGFGGSVAALRLVEKGYKVLLLEKGSRFAKEDLPKTNWEIKKYLWAPLFRCFGIQEITLLKGVMVLHGAGVGGGSLVYANTLMRPQNKVFASPLWKQSRDFEDQIQKHFDCAEKMLGVTENQIMGPADQALEQLSQDWNIQSTYHRTQVGVYFGQPGVEVDDPYFQGQGPRRSGCTGCGGCMVGCRVGAKNTLDQNYLYLAEKKGLKILPRSEVKYIRPCGPDQKSSGRYEVQTQNQTYQAVNVVLSAGVLGTLKILFHCRDISKTLPQISQMLGKNVRTNGESLCGATSFDPQINLSQGIAIGSAIHPDANTKIEPVRYSEGSDFLRFLAVPLTGSGNFILRPLKLLFALVRQFQSVLKLYLIKDWARSTVILLVMQTVDQKLNLTFGRSGLHFFRRGLKIDRGSEKVPSYFSIAQKASQDMAKILKGTPQNIFSEVLLNIPATAHILGGVGAGSDVKNSVVSSQYEVHGYPGLYVCDGSIIPTNLGVNPSLTIAALAESWASQIKRKEEVI